MPYPHSEVVVNDFLLAGLVSLVEPLDKLCNLAFDLLSCSALQMLRLTGCEHHRVLLPREEVEQDLNLWLGYLATFDLHSLVCLSGLSRLLPLHCVAAICLNDMLNVDYFELDSLRLFVIMLVV